MSNHRRGMVEAVLRAIEMMAVFSAISWVLLWALTHRRSASPGRASLGAEVGGPPPAGLAPGHRLDSDDPDGAAAVERSRRRRHID